MPKIRARVRLLKHPCVPNLLWDHFPTALEKVCSIEEPGVVDNALTMASALVRLFSVVVEAAFCRDEEVSSSSDSQGASSSSVSIHQLYPLVVRDLLSTGEIEHAAHTLASAGQRVVELLHDPTGVLWKKRSPLIFSCTQFLSLAHQRLGLDDKHYQVIQGDKN